MRFPRALARSNKYIANRVMGTWAPYVPPWAVVHHRGRVSGTAYRTPLWAFVRGSMLVIVLTYGETDWSRNVVAAGGGEIERLGKTRRFTAPRIVDAEHADELPPSLRFATRVFGSSLIADLQD